MGLLELMLGRSGEGEGGVEGRSYKLPKENHDFVYPVAVRREELDALSQLLEAEEAAPYLEERTEELQAAFDDLFEEGAPDAADLAERKRDARRTVRPVLETWREQVEAGIGVVYCRPGTYQHLLSFVKICKQRADDGEDPFDLPETFPDVAALLKRLEETTDDQYQAVVHTDLLPAGG